MHDDWERSRSDAFEMLRGDVAARLGETRDAVTLTRRCATCGSTGHGRPTIARDDLDVGIAHSGHVLALAVAFDTRVGIDVELVRGRPPARLDRLAARVLDRTDLAAWRTRALQDRERAFLRAWTAKEAYLKALGVGVTRALAAVDPVGDGWHVRELDAGDADVVLTVVTDRPVTVRLHRRGVDAAS